MKLLNHISLLLLLVSSQSLQSCQNQASPTVNCPIEPKATLNIDRVEEVNLTPTVISKSGQSSELQPTGYKFLGKKNDKINYQIKTKDICTWLYDPDNQIVRGLILPKDGKYILQIAQATGTGPFAIEMAVTSSSIPTSSPPNPLSSESITQPTPSKTPDRPSDRNNSPAHQSNSTPTYDSSDRRQFSCDDAPTYFTCRDAKHLIGQWFEVKQNLFGSKYSKSAAAEFLVGKAYNKYVNKNLTNELLKKGRYYVYNQTIDSIKNIQEIDNDLIMVRAKVTETKTIYPKNIVKYIQKTSFCYEFQKVDAKWKLSRSPDLITNCKKK